MQILVQSCDSLFTLDVDRDDSINDIKYKIEDREFIPANLFRLVCNSRNLELGYACDQLQEMDTVHVMFDLLGGMRAKWRKKRVRRLKRKRRKMRLRAR
jgi:small subunit ribosomal protein S27Ae